MWKVLWATSIHRRSHNIGIDKFIKIRSDNKLKKIYLKGIHDISEYIWFSLTYCWKRPPCLVSWWNEREIHFWKKLDELSSFDLQSCDRHTRSSLNIHKNKINCTHNCDAPAMALSSKLLINDFHSSLQNKSPCSIRFGTEHIYWCSPLPPFTLVTMWILLIGKLPIIQFFCTDWNNSWIRLRSVVVI